MPEATLVEAINLALARAMADDQSVILLGEDIGRDGGVFAALVVVPPQVAILGAGRIVSRLVPIEDRFTTTRMLPLSLSFDHRVVSGGEAARFLAAVKTALGVPV